MLAGHHEDERNAFLPCFCHRPFSQTRRSTQHSQGDTSFNVVLLYLGSPISTVLSYRIVGLTTVTRMTCSMYIVHGILNTALEWHAPVASRFATLTCHHGDHHHRMALRMLACYRRLKLPREISAILSGSRPTSSCVAMRLKSEFTLTQVHALSGPPVRFTYLTSRPVLVRLWPILVPVVHSSAPRAHSRADVAHSNASAARAPEAHSSAPAAYAVGLRPITVRLRPIPVRLRPIPLRLRPIPLLHVHCILQKV